MKSICLKVLSIASVLFISTTTANAAWSSQNISKCTVFVTGEKTLTFKNATVKVKGLDSQTGLVNKKVGTWLTRKGSQILYYRGRGSRVYILSGLHAGDKKGKVTGSGSGNYKCS